jgi:hypothetical protein
MVLILNLYFHANEPLWYPPCWNLGFNSSTQSIYILINFTSPMSYIKIIFLQDKFPFGQLFHEPI